MSARLILDETIRPFEVLPLLVATDGAIAAFGHDGRRLRPSIVIGDVDGLAERRWPGSFLYIRDVIVGVQDLRGRSVMRAFKPDTLKQDRQVLLDIVQRFGDQLALNCFVIRDGTIRVGDPVEPVPNLLSE